jgi:hypothetical protein
MPNFNPAGCSKTTAGSVRGVKRGESEQGKFYQYIDILFVEEWQIMGLPD